MRVISQDGKVNMDYDSTTFMISGAGRYVTIKAYTLHHIFTMAEYSNEEIAQKAMDRLIAAGFERVPKSTFLQENELYEMMKF